MIKYLIITKIFSLILYFVLLKVKKFKFEKTDIFIVLCLTEIFLIYEILEMKNRIEKKIYFYKIKKNRGN